MDRPTFRDRMKKTRPKLIRKIETCFLEMRNEDITLGQILDKYCQVGESRDIIRQRLIEMTKGQLKISDTTLYESIVAAIRDHQTNFEFAARRQGNPLAKYRRKEIKRESKETITVYVHCLECKSVAKVQIPFSDKPVIGLETYVCPECGEIGDAIGHITFESTMYYRAIKESPIPGIFMEKDMTEEEFYTILKKEEEKIIETGY